MSYDNNGNKCTQCNGFGFIIKHEYGDKTKVTCWKCRGSGTK